jgi:hypothetical protein
MVEPITIHQTQPSTYQTAPRVDFEKSRFDNLVWQKGYDVVWQQAITCPCKVKGSDNLPSCKNCGGTGWVFLNKIKTRMILHSMNKETTYKEWQEEKMGTVSISCLAENQVSFMDRITLLDSESIHKEVLYPIVNEKGIIGAYTTYEIKSVTEMFLFRDGETKLNLVDKNDFTFEGNIIKFGEKFRGYIDPEKLKIGIRYENLAAFYVIDNTRDMMTTLVVNPESGKEEPIRMPLAGVGRRAHYVLDASKFSGSYILDNSYKPLDNSCELKFS